MSSMRLTHASFSRKGKSYSITFLTTDLPFPLANSSHTHSPGPNPYSFLQTLIIILDFRHSYIDQVSPYQVDRDPPLDDGKPALPPPLAVATDPASLSGSVVSSCWPSKSSWTVLRKRGKCGRGSRIPKRAAARSMDSIAEVFEVGPLVPVDCWPSAMI